MPPRKKKNSGGGDVDMSSPMGRAPVSGGSRSVPDLGIPDEKSRSSRAPKFDLDDADDLVEILEIVGPDRFHEIEIVRRGIAKLSEIAKERSDLDADKAMAAREIMDVVAARGLWRGFKVPEGTLSIRVPGPRRTLEEGLLRQTLWSALSEAGVERVEEEIDRIVAASTREIPGGAPFVQWTPRGSRNEDEDA